jgi:hypothetical protein
MTKILFAFEQSPRGRQAPLEPDNGSPTFLRWLAAGWVLPIFLDMLVKIVNQVYKSFP